MLWLEALPQSEREPETERERESEREPEPLEPESELEREPASLPEPASESEREPGPAAEPEPRIATEDEEDAKSDRSPSSRNVIVRDIDWEEERRRAVARISEQLRQQGSYPTFSLSDLDEDPPPEEPGTVEDIFEAAAGSGGSGRAILTPGRSGGAIGRRITALCDVLGGAGIGIFGFGVASICVEPGEGYTLFAEIKPDYLRARPECTEILGAEAPSGGTSEPGDPTVKCRLVPDEEDVRPGDDLFAEESATVPPRSVDSMSISINPLAPTPAAAGNTR